MKKYFYKIFILGCNNIELFFFFLIFDFPNWCVLVLQIQWFIFIFKIYIHIGIY